MKHPESSPPPSADAERPRIKISLRGLSAATHSEDPSLSIISTTNSSRPSSRALDANADPLESTEADEDLLRYSLPSPMELDHPSSSPKAESKPIAAPKSVRLKLRLSTAAMMHSHPSTPDVSPPSLTPRTASPSTMPEERPSHHLREKRRKKTRTGSAEHAVKERSIAATQQLPFLLQAAVERADSGPSNIVSLNTSGMVAAEQEAVEETTLGFGLSSAHAPVDSSKLGYLAMGFDRPPPLRPGLLMRQKRPAVSVGYPSHSFAPSGGSGNGLMQTASNVSSVVRNGQSFFSARSSSKEGGTPSNPQALHPLPQIRMVDFMYSARKYRKPFSSYASMTRLAENALLSAPPLQGSNGVNPTCGGKYTEADSDDDIHDQLTDLIKENPNDISIPVPFTTDEALIANEKQTTEKRYQARPFQMTNHVLPPHELAHMNSLTEEDLVPIRLELDLPDKTKLRDVFTWNLNDKLISPTKFAEILCADLDLPRSYIATLVDCIHVQLEEYGKTRPIVKISKVGFVPIDICLKVDNYLLQDRVMWDLANDEEAQIQPEQFAEKMASELGLGREHAFLISHHIREQLYRHHVEFTMNDSLVLESTQDLLRNCMTSFHWEPCMYKLKDDMLDAVLKNQERESRRMRRASQKLSRRK